MLNSTQNFYFKLYGDFEREACNKDFQELPRIEKETIFEESFLDRGYFVGTIGLDAEMIRRQYFRNKNIEYSSISLFYFNA